MQKSKNAFTMIELVFVIVILGILASIALPRLVATRDDATIAKGRADIASIRSAIVTERQSRLIKGDSSYIALGTGAGQINEGGLFGGILTYPMTSSSGDDGWSSANQALGVYVYKVAGGTHTLTYTPADGRFMCTNGTGSYCSKLAD
ncbi:MAG: prepilin-type N-terminal cleavage/methylation domain-containing protein [Campylobacterota bacterium]|nr:prepilin-type N-terminal cleavage/methylation domain-containing protein [Campylobacterota bacterium]